MPSYAPNAVEPFDGDETPDLRAILAEVKKGCPSHEPALCKARELQDWYDGDSEKYLSFKPAEDALSWLTRPKRVSFMTRQAVNKLTGHLYKPGPRKRVVAADPAVDVWYARVAQDLALNNLLQAADRLTHLHGTCAIGVYPTGLPNRPINYHLFARQEFCTWTSPDDPRVPTAICTITKSDPETTRYRLWTRTHYYTFYKGKAWGYTPGGWAVARYDPGSSGEHPYGVLPFAIPTYEIPTTTLDVKGVGHLIAKVNRALNVDKSNLALWVHHYARPLGFVTGVGPDWRPRFVDGGFVPLTARSSSTEDVALVPEAKYLESHIDIDAIRSYMVSEANQGMAEVGLPLTLSVANQGGSAFASKASGIAIAAEDADLITYAKGRQPVWERHENTLAALVCKVGSCDLAKQGALAAKLARVAADPSLRLSWAEPQIDLPGADRDNADLFELENGLSDAIDVIRRRQGLNEPEAIEEYRSICRRRHLAARIDAEEAAAVQAAATVDAALDVDEKAPDLFVAEGDDLRPAPDMGVPGGPPSGKVRPEDDVAPSTRLTVAVAPNEPIPSQALLVPIPAMLGGTEI